MYRVAVANNFWGKDDAGVAPLFERMHNAKITCDELRAFYAGKAMIMTMGNGGMVVVILTCNNNDNNSSRLHRR